MSRSLIPVVPCVRPSSGRCPGGVRAQYLHAFHASDQATSTGGAYPYCGKSWIKMYSFHQTLRLRRHHGTRLCARRFDCTHGTRFRRRLDPARHASCLSSVCRSAHPPCSPMRANTAHSCGVFCRTTTLAAPPGFKTRSFDHHRSTSTTAVPCLQLVSSAGTSLA